MFSDCNIVGSAGLIPYIPIPTKYTITLLVTLTVIMYTFVNLFRRFYLERYERDEDGKLYAGVYFVVHLN